MSTFTLAVLFAGMHYGNWAFGVAAMLGDLPGLAIGVGLFLVGVAVAIGGVIISLETTVDRDYLLLLLFSPLLSLVFIVDNALSRLDGIALLLLFGLILGYPPVKKTGAERPSQTPDKKRNAGERLSNQADRLLEHATVER